jgi:hypothetical protein
MELDIHAGRISAGPPPARENTRARNGSLDGPARVRLGTETI